MTFALRDECRQVCLIWSGTNRLQGRHNAYLSVVDTLLQQHSLPATDIFSLCQLDAELKSLIIEGKLLSSRARIQSQPALHRQFPRTIPGRKAPSLSLIRQRLGGSYVPRQSIYIDILKSPMRRYSQMLGKPATHLCTQSSSNFPEQRIVIVGFKPGKARLESAS